MVARALSIALLSLAPATALAGPTCCQTATERKADCVPVTAPAHVARGEASPRQRLWSAFAPGPAMMPVFSALLSASRTLPPHETVKSTADPAPDPIVPHRMPLYLTRAVELL